jgi:hypothetical protein
MTVVVPTRERADTLLHCLRSIVSQDYDALDILVSDNCSADGTREVVESFRDPRIRYVNTGRRMSMTANWNFALEHVRGGYVTYIGDDDGFTPDGIRDAANLLAAGSFDGLVWKKAQYCWPSHPTPGRRNALIVPVANYLVRCDARQVAADMADFWTPYFAGPCIYNGFVHFDVFRKLAKPGMPFFQSVTPDAYSSFALAAGMKEYLYTSRPLSVNGASGHSNGAHAGESLRRDDTPSAKYFAENDQPLHPRMPAFVYGSVIGAVLEAALQANDHCWNGTLRFDFEKLFRTIIRQAAPAIPERYQAAVDALEQNANGDPHLLRAIASAVRRYPNRPVTLDIEPGWNDTELTLDASAFDVADIHGAATLVSRMLGPYKPPPISSRYRRSAKYLIHALRTARGKVGRTVWE